MSAQDIQPLLKSQHIGVVTQLAAQQTRGDMVAKYRRYAEGDHDARMTTEMRQLLSVKADPSGAHPYNINYMALSIDTLVDRLNLTTVEGDTDGLNKYVEELLKQNRIDGLQLSVHEATIRDADSFLLVDYDNEKKRVRWTHELAFDGTNGVMVFYETSNSETPFLAIKIWSVKGVDDKLIERLRCNLYYKDKIHRYYRDTVAEAPQGEWQEFSEDGFPAKQTWLAEVMPIIHFRNAGASSSNYGKSDLKDLIPLQDTLNATNVSMVATSQLTGFPVRYAMGFNPPAGVTPGMWVVIAKEGLTADQKVDIGVMEQGEILPFVQQADFTIKQIDTISRSSIPALNAAGADASGEALKQKESGLLGKVRRAHIGFGNAWERAVEVSIKVERAYGSQQPPEGETLSARWESGEVRNDTEVIDNAIKVVGQVGQKEFLRLIAPVFDYDEEKIQDLLDEKAEQDEAQMEQMASAFGTGTPPAFGNKPNGQARPMMGQNRGNPMMNKTNGAK
jgi:hypothetical protein